jgi:hypothetical protein
VEEKKDRGGEWEKIKRKKGEERKAGREGAYIYL